MTVTDHSLRPEDALESLAARLREEGPVISEHVAEPAEAPALGELAAAGPRCASDPGSYAAVVELVREGYLCHYGEPRLLARLDSDLRLLVGDHLYARGIERLARLGDLLAVAELSDLISTAAQFDAAPDADPDAREIAWLAAVVAIGAGPGAGHEAGKATLRESGDAEPLWRSAREQAERFGLSEHLSVASEAVGFAAPNRG
jgi:hypothetical protein